ncbi:predicted protein [Streptomyces filamentosus NRRL 15998]|uniref:Predicted protein n=1 Tax=Streptomyces filamentosus NRRL 15998 TaxID=457431 RepID=D6AVD1_STRFL|nr:predicted protein [Streptomyces filamentosus NRRL 15998]
MGGPPESHCHSQRVNAIRYLVAGWISFPAWGQGYASICRRRGRQLVSGFHGRWRWEAQERKDRKAELGGDRQRAIDSDFPVHAGFFKLVRRRETETSPWPGPTVQNSRSLVH